MTASAGTPPPRPVLVGLTPEARAALGGMDQEMDHIPFRVGRESRLVRTAAGRVVTERRRPATPPNNDLYLVDAAQPLNVSRDHFLIAHNGSHYVLVDRQSACGTIVEGVVVGGRNTGGAVPLHDGDVIIVGSSASPYVFKFKLR
jgi:hypothetical protein